MMAQAQSDAVERKFSEYPVVVWVVWDDIDRTDGYLCESAELSLGWVTFVADAYLWRDKPDGGANERSYFDRPTRISLPADKVRQVEWREAA